MSKERRKKEKRGGPFKERLSLIVKIDDLRTVGFSEAYGPVTFKMANNKTLLLSRHPRKRHMEKLF